MRQIQVAARHPLAALLVLGTVLACGSTPAPSEPGSGGSSTSSGAQSGRAGAASGDSGASGGVVSAGAGGTAGVAGAGAGTPATGGVTAMGGAAPSAGRANAGGETSLGGRSALGGAPGNPTAGRGGRAAIGGEAGLGGAPASGGARAMGGAASATGGAGGRAAGGASSGGMSAGGSGGAGYRPCASNPCKVMPFGDSITYGVNDEGDGGYRGPLFASAVAAGQKLTFTGSLSNGPTSVSGQTFPKNNEGHSGWGISEVTPYSGNNAGIATVIPAPGFSTSSGGVPDIILLHIGTNDQGSLSAAQMTSDLSGLLDKLITNAPNAYIVVAQIIPLGYGTNDIIKTYNQSIPGLVQQRAGAGKHITSVDLFTGFTPSSMLGSDNIHPNSTGYKFMADRWYSVIGPLLPE